MEISFVIPDSLGHALRTMKDVKGKMTIDEIAFTAFLRGAEEFLRSELEEYNLKQFVVENYPRLYKLAQED